MPITDVDIRRAAMDLLARREHGSQELFQKLVKRFSKYRSSEASEQETSKQEIIESEAPLSLEERISLAVERLCDEGLQSDERLAEAFIRARANRGQGPLKIKAELRQKGISDQIISQAMSESEQDWFALAADVASKKFREMGSDPKERAKRSRFLQQRGFSFDHISSIDGV